MALESNRFTMTYRSYLAYVLHYRYAKTWLYRLITLGVPSLLLVLGVWMALNGRSAAAGSVFAMVGGLIVWFALLNFVFPLWRLWSAKRNGAYRQDCKVYIDPDHIWTASEEGELKKPWKSIESIYVTKRHGFIYFHKCNAFVIPKWAFASQKEADAFFAAAKGFLAAAKATAAD